MEKSTFEIEGEGGKNEKSKGAGFKRSYCTNFGGVVWLSIAFLFLETSYEVTEHMA